MTDLRTRTTERVSVASDGTQSDGFSLTPTISADGRYVGFSSGATNLVAGDTNGQTDGFVHDRETGKTERVSVASDGTAGDGLSSPPSFSADGRFVVFNSDSTNLVAGDTNGRPTSSSATARPGRPSGSRSDRAASRAPGTRATSRSAPTAASSRSTAMPPTSSRETSTVMIDIFVRDRQTGTTELIPAPDAKEVARR